MIILCKNQQQYPIINYYKIMITFNKINFKMNKYRLKHKKSDNIMEFKILNLKEANLFPKIFRNHNHLSKVVDKTNKGKQIQIFQAIKSLQIVY